LEWPLDPGDADGTKMEQLLELLGFQAVGIVQKRRRVFAGHGELRDFAITIDDVQSLGLFAEIELVVADSSEIEAARQRIKQLGERLGLHQAEPRSYLRLLLGQKSPADQGG
jgi:adenylate cyclase class 2